MEQDDHDEIQENAETEDYLGEIEEFSGGTGKGKKRGASRDDAAKLFHCSYQQAAPFKKSDTLHNNSMEGFICKKDGPMDGSLFITKVNDQRLNEPQLIYGTPKLEYPYRNFESDEYADFDNRYNKEVKKFVVANKWNGVNILFFKYVDASGKTFVSAKTKGSAFLTNGPFGAFLSLTTEALGLKGRTTISMEKLPEILSELKDEKVQSKTLELCGSKEPHLVKYDFPIALKPLFITYQDGTIAPCSNPEDIKGDFEQNKLVQLCKQKQKEDLEANERYRKENNLQHRYEHNHFIIEGRVLYLLNENGRILKRTMYKIKPKDIEEVHWGNFDATMQGRVREALEKLHVRNKPLTDNSLQSGESRDCRDTVELDMGPKEWGKFGKDVMKYANQLTRGKIPSKLTDKRHVLIVSGYPGSGREQLVDALKTAGTWTILKGGADKIKAEMAKKLSDNSRVVIDDFSITFNQRKGWVEEAMKFGVLKIDCVFFDKPKEECQKIVFENRKKKTPPKERLHEEDDSFQAKLTKPLLRDGFGKIYEVKKEEDLNPIIEKLKKEEEVQDIVSEGKTES